MITGTNARISKSRKMRIVLSVHHYLDWNTGAPGSVMELSKALQDQGHWVELLSFDDLPHWTRRLLPSIGVRLRPFIFPWFVAWRMWVRLTEFDVVDFLSGDGCWLFFLQKKMKASPKGPILITHGAGLEHIYNKVLSTETSLITYSRGIDSFISSLYDVWYSFYLRLWEVKMSYECADAGLFLNQVDRDYAIAHFSIRAERTRVVTNGIPNSLLALGAPRRLSGKKLVVAQIGSYVPMKGVHYGSKALSVVMASCPNVCVRFLGTCCSRDWVLNQFPPELHDRIEVLSQYERDELPRLLADCEIKLFPTLSEGFGVALLEAMACGLAPVSTMTPGPMAIIEPDVEGLLVPPKDSHALAKALMRLVLDEDLRFRIRENAYRKAQRYSWEEVAKKRVQIYEQLLSSASLN